MSETQHEPEPKNFAPKDPPKLDPPRDDPISRDELAKYDGKTNIFDITCRVTSPAPLLTRSPPHSGTGLDKRSYVAIKGTVFDVSGKDAYLPGGGYHGTSTPYLSHPILICAWTNE